MQRPASNRAWCERWDSLSQELLDELRQPNCRVDKVSELVRERRRLTTAHPVNGVGDPVVPIDEQRRWLKQSLERESRLAQLAVEVKEGLSRSLISLRAGRAVRTRFDSTEAVPRVINTQV